MNLWLTGVIRSFVQEMIALDEDLLRDAARAAYGQGRMPPEVEEAALCEQVGLGLVPGGIWDQPYRRFRSGRAALNVYRTVQSYQSKQMTEVDFAERYPEKFRQIVMIEKRLLAEDDSE